ncbi:MAG: hypothetical protein V3T31_10340, partial [candidate division Zixibacteria bacterium]
RTISTRGNLNWSRGTSSYLATELRAAWNLSRSTNLGFTYRLSDNNLGYRSVSYSLRLSCRMSGRSSVYLGYTDSDFSRASGSHTQSLQAGLRTGF